MQGSARDGATGRGVALLSSLCLLGAAVTLVVGLLVPPWGLMMMALSVAFSGIAFASKAIRVDADPPPPPAPVPLSVPPQRPVTWDVDPRRALESAALTLPPNLFELLGPGGATPPDQQPKAAENRPVEQPPSEERTSAQNEHATEAGPPDGDSSPGALVAVPWGSGVQPPDETPPDREHSESAMLARVVAEGELIRAEVRELHERLRASLLADLDQIASDQQREREGLADEIEQLHERSTAVLNEIRQLSEQYRQARDGLAGAVRQTATWLVRSRDELYERLDSVSRAVEKAGSARYDMQELREDVTQALARQRMDYADALAVASAEREANERLSTRLDEQAGVAVETLEQQKQLQEKLDAVTRLTDEARSSWRGELEELQEKVVQAVVEQRIGYASAAVEASARDRANLEPLVHLVQEQSALMMETLQEQRQLHSEVASLREQVAGARRTTTRAPRPTAGDDEPRATVVRAVPPKAQSITRPKKAAGTTRATATKAAVAKAAKKAPAAKAATKASPTKVAAKAPSVKAATATKKATAAKAAAKAPPPKVAPAKTATKSPPAKGAHKAAPARSATKAVAAKAASKAPAKAVPRTTAGRVKRGAATVTR